MSRFCASARAASSNAVFPMPAEYEGSRAQVERVEELSDAFHLAVGDQAALVAYLLEIRHAR